ncbi:MAG: gliding motility-associated C-terminal domain-containing protein [Flavobacteriales bacterium]|nr:gliding motility-associated C-terminal domain-containing protein [Flavobacteriales bacterium]
MISYFKKSLSILFLLSSLISFNTINAQCFEIESILVDACGSPEGENEMVRFKVSTTALNTSNISVNWASANTWLGICQNTTSANIITALNNTITGCGVLIEPTGGILPANSNVLFLTSTAIDVSANSFANLNDTLFVIFQCAGNTQGHFANGSGSGTRTLSISFSSPSGCTDIVTYDKTPLGNSDGASVSFNPAGNPTYFNNGCQAAFIPTDITANILPSSTLTICPGDSINLFGTLVGPIDSLLWSGGFGNFNTPKNDTTTYFSSINDTLPFYIIINGATTCSAGVSDSILINIVPKPNISILEGTLIDVCNGTPITLNANGATNYLWSTGETTNSININTPSNYFVTDTSNYCYPDTAFIQVNITPQLVITLSESGPIDICQGQSITLHANGASNYIWSTSAITDSITVNTADTYFVYGGGVCPSDTDSVVINIILPINLNINEGNSLILCLGNTLTLHTTSNGNTYSWNNGSNFDSLTVNTIGEYWVTASNNVCPNVSDTINIIDDIIPSATIIGSTVFCVGTSLVLTANGIGNFNWSNGETGNSTTINFGQQIILTAANNCGSSVTDILNITEEDCNIETGIIIPNVFTPNGDSFNDVFKVEGVNITSIVGSIYNRWGLLLYEWSGIDNGWNGENYNEGTYFYIIKTTFINNKTEQFKGSILLLN